MHTEPVRTERAVPAGSRPQWQGASRLHLSPRLPRRRPQLLPPRRVQQWHRLPQRSELHQLQLRELLCRPVWSRSDVQLPEPRRGLFLPPWSHRRRPQPLLLRTSTRRPRLLQQVQEVDATTVHQLLQDYLRPTSSPFKRSDALVPWCLSTA